MRCLCLIAALALTLPGCATPETRLRGALNKAGLSKPVSACMADRMVDRLSLGQLLKMRGLSKLQGRDWREIPMEEFLKRTRSLQDPEILGVTTSSAAICAVKSI